MRIVSFCAVQKRRQRLEMIMSLIDPFGSPNCDSKVAAALFLLQVKESLGLSTAEASKAGTGNLFDPNLVDLKEAPMSTSPAQSRKHRILCVDDEIAGTRIRGEILEEHGYSVVLYHYPLAVLQSELSLFDLAVLDFQMPGLSGRDLLLRMRALGARFPVVLLTAAVDDLSCADRVLFARCIDKGRPIEHLLETIAEFLDPNQTPDYGT
jgi:CheY-like chemotaxis protein